MEEETKTNLHRNQKGDEVCCNLIFDHFILIIIILFTKKN